jgi:organic hydroperoxide reductase OsmC/OhrA
MEKIHHYKLALQWTGNQGTGISSYRSYNRSHTIAINGKAIIRGSADPSFMGDRSCHNPEDLLLSSIAACHMLWYLSLCAESGIIVLQYTDNAIGRMQENEDGCGRFTEILLHPEITVAESFMIKEATTLHHKANQYCFMASSVNFPIHHEPVVKVGWDMPTGPPDIQSSKS